MAEKDEAPPSPLPPPSPALAVLGALLLELERETPGVTERIRARLENDANFAAAVRIRGPRTEPQVRAAVESAHAWAGMLTVVAEAVRGPRRRRLFWGRMSGM